MDVSIHLSDGTQVTEGKSIYKVNSIVISDREYRDFDELLKWSGVVRFRIEKHTVLKVNNAFNNRSFHTRDAEGVEHHFSAKDFSDMKELFGTRKAAQHYVTIESEKDVIKMKEKVDAAKKKLKEMESGYKRLEKIVKDWIKRKANKL